VKLLEGDYGSFKGTVGSKLGVGWSDSVYDYAFIL